MALATLTSDPYHRELLMAALRPFWPDVANHPDVKGKEPRSHDLLREDFGEPDLPRARHSETSPGLYTSMPDLPIEAAEDSEQLIGLYSSKELLRHKDFSSYTEGELLAAARLARAIDWSLLSRASRRHRIAKRGTPIDIRRSLRSSIRTGGEILRLSGLGQKRKPRRLIVLCDISGSMERYTRVLLQFIHAIHASRSSVEVFVFGTRLTRITHLIRHRNVDFALSAVSSKVVDWSGGTRIGEAISTFNRRWANRVAAHGGVIIIISDGWDRGSPERLAAEMQRLQRSSHRLIWLNPLLGSESYSPATQGMQAALPFVDDFLPSHDMASLESLAQVLNRISASPQRTRHRADKSQDMSAGARKL